MPTVEELQAEMDALDERRVVVKSLLDAMKAYERVTAKHKANGAERQQPAKPRAAAAMNETATVASELMEAAGGPVAVTLIVDEMRRRGMQVPLLNTNNVISARLSNNPKFAGRRGQGYWFADRPWPGDDIADLLGGQPDMAGEEES